MLFDIIHFIVITISLVGISVDVMCEGFFFQLYISQLFNGHCVPKL